MNRVWPRDRADAILAITALAVILAVRWRALAGSVYAVDDYLWLPIEFDYALLAPFNNSQGRFLIPVIAEILHALGANLHRAQTTGVVVLAVAQVTTALMICRLWRIASNSLSALLLVIFVCLFPYQVEFFLWRGYAAFFGIAFAVSMAGVLMAQPGRANAVAAVALLLSGLLIYQSGFLLAATAVVIATGLDAQRALICGVSFDARPHGRRGLMLAAALAIYVPGVFVVFAVADIHDPLGRISTANLDFAVIRQRAVTVFEVLVHHDRIVPPFLRFVNFFFVLAAVVGVLTWLARRGASARGTAAIALIAVAAAPLISVAFSIVLPSFSYREYGTIAVAWGGGLIMAMTGAPVWVRAPLAMLSAIAILGFVGINDEVIGEAERVTQRERALVGRMARRVELLDREGQVTRLAIVGIDPAPQAGLRFVTSPADAFGGYVPVRQRNVIEPSVAFNTGDIYALPVVNELSGRQFAQSLAPLDAAARCRSSPSWPAAHSIHIDNDTAIICLTPRP